MTSSPATRLPLIRGAEERRIAVLRAKRRIFIIGLLLLASTAVISLAVTLRGQGNFPGLGAYLTTDVGVLVMCASALIALRNIENVTLVERFGTVGSVVYLLYWDVTALSTHYLPHTEFLMTSVAEFLLAAALMCLVVPRQYLTSSLSLLFIVHETLIWANLLQFP